MRCCLLRYQTLTQAKLNLDVLIVRAGAENTPSIRLFDELYSAEFAIEWHLDIDEVLDHETVMYSLISLTFLAFCVD